MIHYKICLASLHFPAAVVGIQQWLKPQTSQVFRRRVFDLLVNVKGVLKKQKTKKKKPPVQSFFRAKDQYCKGG